MESAFQNVMNDIDRCISLMQNEIEFGDRLSNADYRKAYQMAEKFKAYTESLQELIENRSI